MQLLFNRFDCKWHCDAARHLRTIVSWFSQFSKRRNHHSEQCRQNYIINDRPARVEIECILIYSFNVHSQKSYLIIGLCIMHLVGWASCNEWIPTEIIAWNNRLLLSNSREYIKVAFVFSLRVCQCQPTWQWPVGCAVFDQSLVFQVL